MAAVSAASLSAATSASRYSARALDHAQRWKMAMAEPGAVCSEILRGILAPAHLSVLVCRWGNSKSTSPVSWQSGAAATPLMRP